MLRLLATLLVLGGLGFAMFWLISAPSSVDATTYDGLTGNKTNGAQVFHAAGCASCHIAPGADFSEQPVLAGGQAFSTEFGVFFAPNISPDPQFGIGGWSVLAFANAVQNGVSPDGTHYYPAFPYTAYAKMTPQNLVDLKLFMDDLPMAQVANRAHVIGFPFDRRRALGGWKWMFVRDGWVLDTAETQEIERGRYLVEALAHCGECHTARKALGVLDYENWLRGGYLPADGRVPGLAPDQLNWSEEDIVYYLESGFTPEFDNSSGAMAHVIDNMSMLPPEDHAAIAAYLLALP